MTDLYVYYKVRALDAAVLAPRVRAMQAALAVSFDTPAQLKFQLKRRPETKDGLQTWMEVYPGVPEAFSDALAQAAGQAGLEHLTSGPRRSEVFVDLDPEDTPCA